MIVTYKKLITSCFNAKYKAKASILPFNKQYLKSRVESKDLSVLTLYSVHQPCYMREYYV